SPQNGPAARQTARLLGEQRMRHTFIAGAFLVLFGADAVAQAPLPAAPAPAADQKRPSAPGAAKQAGGPLECLAAPFMTVNVGSPVDGVLDKVLVDRGDVVKKGQVVAKLQSGVEAAAVGLSQARVEFGHRKVERNEILYQKQLISAQDRD